MCNFRNKIFMDVMLHYQSYPGFLDVRIGGMCNLDNKGMGLEMGLRSVFDPAIGVG